MGKKGPNGARGASGNGLAATVARVVALLDAVERELEAAGLTPLTEVERSHSNGKLHEGEDPAMVSVLDAVDAQPGVFVALAESDHGTDKARVETAPAREALARRRLLVPLAERVAAIGRDISDDVLHCAELAKDLTVPAYRILVVNAPTSATLRKKGADAIDFYGHGPRARAAKSARKAKKTARATAPAPRVARVARKRAKPGK